jgi:MFS transporter, FHS family, glucose/mannose:H+ symporter
MPSGRSSREQQALAVPPADEAARTPVVSAGPRPVPRVALPLALLGIAILTYVASEVGVSNWLVRFLEPAPLSTATLALSLFWGGLAVGRLVSSQLADRFDHVTFTAACAVILSVALIGAIAVPSLPMSIALFAVVGVASGPIFPMIQAIGGERYPDRSAAVGGLLTGCGVVGGTIYPPLMGVLSVTVGLTAAMFGNVILGFVCAGVLLAVRRDRRADARRRTARSARVA